MSRKRSMDASMEQISNKILKLCLKRDRVPEPEAPSNKRRMVETQLTIAKVDMLALQKENQRLRTEMDQKDKLIQYGMSDIKRLNADILSLKHQVFMMEDYIASMDKRPMNSDVFAY